MPSSSLTCPQERQRHAVSYAMEEPQDEDLMSQQRPELVRSQVSELGSGSSCSQALG